MKKFFPFALAFAAGLIGGVASSVVLHRSASFQKSIYLDSLFVENIAVMGRGGQGMLISGDGLVFMKSGKPQLSLLPNQLSIQDKNQVMVNIGPSRPNQEVSDTNPYCLCFTDPKTEKFSLMLNYANLGISDSEGNRRALLSRDAFLFCDKTENVRASLGCPDNFSNDAISNKFALEINRPYSKKGISLNETSFDR